MLATRWNSERRSWSSTRTRSCLESRWSKRSIWTAAVYLIAHSALNYSSRSINRIIIVHSISCSSSRSKWATTTTAIWLIQREQGWFSSRPSWIRFKGSWLGLCMSTIKTLIIMSLMLRSLIEDGGRQVKIFQMKQGLKFQKILLSSQKIK